jgi:hypothetical protein
MGFPFEGRFCSGYAGGRIASDQLGHSSIPVTVDLYGHLVPNANDGWVDGLDSTEPAATQTQPETDHEPDENLK